MIASLFYSIDKTAKSIYNKCTNYFKLNRKEYADVIV